MCSVCFRCRSEFSIKFNMKRFMDFRVDFFLRSEVARIVFNCSCKCMIMTYFHPLWKKIAFDFARIRPFSFIMCTMCFYLIYENKIKIYISSWEIVQINPEIVLGARGERWYDTISICRLKSLSTTHAYFTPYTPDQIYPLLFRMHICVCCVCVCMFNGSLVRSQLSQRAADKRKINVPITKSVI